MSHSATAPAPLIEVTRAGHIESVHAGHAVVMGPEGEVLASWGDPAALIYPRSSCKMVQALPLVEGPMGADLPQHRLALCCASHSGRAEHVGAVGDWLSDMGLTDDDLRCGVSEPQDRDERNRLIRDADQPCQIHNNCSGKHAGFLLLNQQLRGGPEYVDPEHPVQQAIRQALEDVTEVASPGYGIDGCSAPNYLTTPMGLARATMRFATARSDGDLRARAMVRLREAMMAHPSLVAGSGRTCTELMTAMGRRAAIKTGAEGVFIAIVPERGIGIALKIADGTPRASEAAITGILIALGVLDADDPAAQRRLGPMKNWRGIEVGDIRLAPGFADRPF